MKKTIEQVVTETLRNVLNYPPNLQSHVLGTDMSKPIDAVVTALKDAGYTDLPARDESLSVGARVRVTADIPLYKERVGRVVYNPTELPDYSVRVLFTDQDPDRPESEVFRPTELEVIS